MGASQKKWPNLKGLAINFLTCGLPCAIHSTSLPAYLVAGAGFLFAHLTAYTYSLRAALTHCRSHTFANPRIARRSFGFKSRQFAKNDVLPGLRYAGPGFPWVS